MAFNRISEFLSSEIGFPTRRISLSYQQLGGSFSGPSTLQQLLQEERQKGTEEGKRITVRKYQEQKEKELVRYIANVVEIGRAVRDTSNHFLQDFQIKAFRARLDPASRSLNLFFLIDSKLENENFFAAIVSEIERKILGKNNKIVDILYLNSRNKDVDNDAIISDYPFLFDLKKQENAVKS